jgi:hypothetical protein
LKKKRWRVAKTMTMGMKAIIVPAAIRRGMLLKVPDRNCRPTVRVY